MGSNTNIIVFLVLLGMLVALMSKSGASRAYGSWASRSIKTKRGALFATAGLGALIFVDDYFNCLTVGTVMRPVTERYKISKAKLAYIIDATAAPVCIIAPISSWAAAVGSSLPESSSLDGFSLFLQTIPFNLYALLTIVMVIFMIAMQFDFGKMKKAEAHPELGTAMSDEIDDSQAGRDRKGRVFDLVIPIITLIVLCIAAMLYTGGILEGKSIAGAFADCDSSLSLVLGSFFTIVLVFLLYIPRRVISFSEFAASLVEGFKAMVPAILILTLAWTLSGVCGEDYLNAGGFVSQVVNGNQMAHTLMPGIFFLIALGLAFATGHLLGHLRNFDPHHYRHLRRYGRTGHGAHRGRRAGGRCLRRSYFSHFRHHHSGLHRRQLQPYRARIHPDALCLAGGRLLFDWLSRGGLHLQRMAGPGRRLCAADGGFDRFAGAV